MLATSSFISSTALRRKCNHHRSLSLFSQQQGLGLIHHYRLFGCDTFTAGSGSQILLTSKKNEPLSNHNNTAELPNYPLVDGQDTTTNSKISSATKIVIPNRSSWWTDNWRTPAKADTTNKTNNSDASQPQQQQQQDSNIVHYIKGGLPCDVDNVPKFVLSNYGKEALYTLVLLRHGESEWNLENKYTGWCDVNLTDRGRQEARDAGRLLRENDIEIDHAFTSFLQRACFTTNIALNASKQHWVPVTKTWRLNERHYGALQGYNKDTAWEQLGLDQELVMEMRRSYDVRPPLMDDEHPHWHGKDRRYAKVMSKEQLDHSRAESLKDAAERILPFYQSVIIPSLQAGNKCLIVSHANTLRTLIKFIDSICDENIKGMSIPTGIPLLYRLDANFKPVCPFEAMELTKETFAKGYTWATSRRYGFNGVYLGDLGRLQEIQKKRDVTNRDWQRIILRNIAKSLLLTIVPTATATPIFARNGIFPNNYKANDDNQRKTTHQKQIMDTRQLWWKIRAKLNEKPEFRNMMLLSRMMEYLEGEISTKHSRYITMVAFEKVLNQIHLDTTGKVVEPFEELSGNSKKDDDDDDYTMSYAIMSEDH